MIIFHVLHYTLSILSNYLFNYALNTLVICHAPCISFIAPVCTVCFNVNLLWLCPTYSVQYIKNINRHTAVSLNNNRGWFLCRFFSVSAECRDCSTWTMVDSARLLAELSHVPVFPQSFSLHYWLVVHISIWKLSGGVISISEKWVMFEYIQILYSIRIISKYTIQHEVNNWSLKYISCYIKLQNPFFKSKNTKLLTVLVH